MITHDGVTIVPMPQTGAPTTGTWDAGTLIVDALGDIYKCGVSGTPGTWQSLVAAIPPADLVANFPEFIDTFVNGVQAGMGWSIAQGGGGTLSQIAPPAGTGGRNGVVGVIAASVGKKSGYAGAILGTTLLLFESGNVYTVWARVLATQLATSGQDGVFRIGFMDTNTTVDPVNGAYFEYSSVTSANWLCKTASNNARTAVTTPTAVQTANWIDLKIQVNATTGTATFWIDDVQVGVINTNVPTGAGSVTSLGLVFVKTNGNNPLVVAVDRIYLKLGTP